MVLATFIRFQNGGNQGSQQIRADIQTDVSRSRVQCGLVTEETGTCLMCIRNKAWPRFLS